MFKYILLLLSLTGCASTNTTVSEPDPNRYIKDRLEFYQRHGGDNAWFFYR
jgi:hypothetical protein